MNDRYKFRGKRTENGMWITGGYIEWTDIKGNKQYQIVSFSGYHNDVVPETVGQCTGMQDVNEKEIYDMDIVIFTFFTYLPTGEVEESKKGRIIYNSTGFVFQEENGEIYILEYMNFDSECDIEVIGNEIDNPELLKQ